MMTCTICCTQGFLKETSVFRFSATIFGLYMTSYDQHFVNITCYCDRISPHMTEYDRLSGNMTFYPFWGYIVLIYPKKDGWSYSPNPHRERPKTAGHIRSYLTANMTGYDLPVIFFWTARRLSRILGGAGF